MPHNLHTNEVRWFSGAHPVKELRPEEWFFADKIEQYEQMNTNHGARIRGYEALSDKPEFWKKGDWIRLSSTLCFAKPHKNKPGFRWITLEEYDGATLENGGSFSPVNYNE